MAKRARGSSSRPGQRAPLQRGTGAARSTASPGPTAPRPATLTPEEEARAAALEAQIVADEKSAEEANQRTRTRARRSVGVEPGVRTGSIAVRASEEYAYVARDIRRIALIGGSLVAFLIGLWVVVQVTGIGPF
ncbi:MAG: hypothetical protein OEV61_08645 [Chloroflexota bacterium]|nr:hypothetical protein [Chloroflexota bacterium]MDH5243877.1 hypothetical protein [Chloroflexota bacterium]